MSKLRSLVLDWPNFGTETGFERWIQASIAIAESLDVYDHNLTTCPGMANLITSGNSPETDRRPLSGSIGSSYYCKVTLIGILREIGPDVAVTKTVLAVGCATGAEGPLEHPVKMPSDATETITIAQSS